MFVKTDGFLGILPLVGYPAWRGMGGGLNVVSDPHLAEGSVPLLTIFEYCRVLDSG